MSKHRRYSRKLISGHSLLALLPLGIIALSCTGNLKGSGPGTGNPNDPAVVDPNNPNSPVTDPNNPANPNPVVDPMQPTDPFVGLVKGFAETAADAGGRLFSGVFGRRDAGGNGGRDEDSEP